MAGLGLGLKLELGLALWPGFSRDMCRLMGAIQTMHYADGY